MIQLAPGYLWDRDVDRQQTRLCDMVGRNLSRQEWDDVLDGQGYRPTCPQWPDGP